MPELKRLEASDVWVDKDAVEQYVKDAYGHVLRELAEMARPGSPLKQALDDAYHAVSKATSHKLINRHRNLWGSKIRDAKKAAEKEMQGVEKMVGLLKELGRRQADVNALERVERRADERYARVCEQQSKAAALIKDLQAHLAVGS